MHRREIDEVQVSTIACVGHASIHAVQVPQLPIEGVSDGEKLLIDNQFRKGRTTAPSVDGANWRTWDSKAQSQLSPRGDRSINGPASTIPREAFISPDSPQASGELLEHSSDHVVIIATRGIASYAPSTFDMDC